MPATPYDSAIYRGLFRDDDAAALFGDSAEVRAMLIVEGALARVQGRLGLIPEISAAAIHRASLEVQIDPAALSVETGQSAVVVPALIKAFRAEMQAPEHAQYVHWGATSQDIMDTGLILRLRRLLELFETRLHALLAVLADLAQAHADLPLAGRTFAQAATPTSFGAVAASWGRPLLRQHARLGAVQAEAVTLSLSGAAGTLSAMGAKGPEVRAGLATELGLTDPGASWHTERDRITALTGWMAEVAASLGKLGEDLILLCQSGVQEVTLGQGGGSSTMPQKSNPVMPSLLVALARHLAALHSAMLGAALHRQQRDGAAWFTEWLSLPQMALGLARGLGVAQDLAANLTPDPDRMAAGLDDGSGLIYAEALSFALAATLPRPEAQAAVKELCTEVKATGTPLAGLAAARWPALDFTAVFDARAQLGTAPAEARAFAHAARALTA